MVSIGVMILRKQQPGRARPFRTPLVWIVCPLAVCGCLLLFLSLPTFALEVFAGWAVFGLLIYFFYSHRRSQLAAGTVS
jgi:APA family basic amino acid/polyamine antiporter